MQNIIILLIFFQLLKGKSHCSGAVQTQAADWIWPTGGSLPTLDIGHCIRSNLEIYYVPKTLFGAWEAFSYKAHCQTCWLSSLPICKPVVSLVFCITAVQPTLPAKIIVSEGKGILVFLLGPEETDSPQHYQNFLLACSLFYLLHFTSWSTCSLGL